MSSSKYITKVKQLKADDFDNDVLNIPYCQFEYPQDSEFINPQTKRYCYIVEDVEEMIPQAIVNVQDEKFKFVKVEVVHSILIQQLIKKIEQMQKQIDKLVEKQT